MKSLVLIILSLGLWHPHGVLLCWKASEKDATYIVVRGQSEHDLDTVLGETKRHHYFDKDVPNGLYWYSVAARNRVGNYSEAAEVGPIEVKREVKR